jgi:hypothetical protein
VPARTWWRRTVGRPPDCPSTRFQGVVIFGCFPRLSPSEARNCHRRHLVTRSVSYGCSIQACHEGPRRRLA